MFYPELQGYLIGASSSEEVALFDRGIKVLDDYEVDEYLDQFEFILGESTSQGDTVTVDALKATLLALTRQLVNLHGIELSDDAGQSTILDICEALSALSTWTDKEGIDRILKQDTSNEDRFSELLGFLKGQAPEAFLPFILKVDDQTLGLIAEYGKAAAEETAGFDEVAKSYVEDYIYLRHKLKEPSLWADKAITNLAVLGLPYALHLKHFLQDNSQLVADAVTPEQYAHVAAQLIAIAAVSDVRLVGGLNAIKDHLDTIYLDLERVSALNQAVTTLYMGVSRA